MKLRIFFDFLLSSLCPLCLCGESLALDPEPKTEYELKVVLHFADHRLLTDVFRDRVERELRDGLQASFGDLVSVEVVRDVKDDKDPLKARLDDVLRNGLRSLDGWRERAPVKTHFVLIDYSGVHYTIEARQFDGLTGTPSRLVRRDRTRDPEFVAKAAALLVEEDFGLVGVFDAWPPANKDTPGEDQKVTVQLKGAGLGVDLGRWIQQGDVFSVVQMPVGDAGPGRPVGDALLRVETPPGPGDAGCVCRVFRRYDRPRDAAGAGYRCVKLGTVSAPVRLRLLQALPDGGSGPLRETLAVEIRHNGFGKDDAGMIPKETDGNDAVDTSAEKNGVFDHIAFVSVFSQGHDLQARVPVPLLDDQPVVLAINVAADVGSRQAFQRREWERDVDTAWREQAELFREIDGLATKPDKRAEAMKKIQEALDRSRTDFTRLTEVRTALAKAAPFSSPAADDRLAKINEGANELRDFLKKMQDIDAEENDPKKRQWLTQAEQGQRLENDLEIDKALDVYDRVLKDGYQNDKLKDHVDELRRKWMPKSEEHRKARAFIYEVWPTLDDAGLKDKLAEAQKAVATCEAAGDKITLTKFQRATEAHGVRMKQELDELKPNINLADEQQAKLIKEVNEALRPLALDVETWLKTAPK